MKITKMLSVVAGVHWFKRTTAVISGTYKGVKAIAESAEDKPAQDEGERGGKFRVYSHTKKRFFYADDFGLALRQAYTDAELKKMEMVSRTARRIQAYGAIFVFIVAAALGFQMRSFVPLFSIFPAMAVMAFAIRRGCWEETFKRREWVGLSEYLNSPGIFGLWR